jgi:hypothetical protein
MKYLKHILIIFLLLPGWLFAQIVISGKVINAFDSTAIPNVNISVEGTLSGTTSAKDGSFKISLKKLPARLIFSHINYQNFEKEFTSSGFLIVSLETKISMLNEVRILSKRSLNITPQKHFLMLDYEITGDKLLMYARDFKSGKYLLLLTNFDGAVLNEIPLKSKPDRLFIDCRNQIYAVYPDYAIEVNLKADKIIFGSELGSTSFKQIEQCLMEINDKYYYSVYYSGKQEVDIYYVDNSYQPVKVKHIVDEQMKSRWKDEARFARMGNIEYTEFDSMFASIIYYTPLYAPLIKRKEDYCIFNFVEGKIETFSFADELISQVKLNLVRDKERKKLYYDALENKAYQLFLKNGIVTLGEIDFEKGSIASLKEIKGFVFPEKINVHNGVVYFMAKSREEDQYKQLYRIIID